MLDSKPKSFRIDNETAARFKEIAEALGRSRQETMTFLINTYEMQALKNSLAGCSKTIEKFDSCCNAITRMYLTALDNKLLLPLPLFFQKYLPQEHPQHCWCLFPVMHPGQYLHYQ